MGNMHTDSPSKNARLRALRTCCPLPHLALSVTQPHGLNVGQPSLTRDNTASTRSVTLTDGWTDDHFSHRVAQYCLDMPS